MADGGMHAKQLRMTLVLIEYSRLVPWVIGLYFFQKSLGSWLALSSVHFLVFEVMRPLAVGPDSSFSYRKQGTQKSSRLLNKPFK
jgi:hypothetical protein